MTTTYISLHSVLEKRPSKVSEDGTKAAYKTKGRIERFFKKYITPIRQSMSRKYLHINIYIDETRPVLARHAKE